MWILVTACKCTSAESQINSSIGIPTRKHLQCLGLAGENTKKRGGIIIVTYICDTGYELTLPSGFYAGSICSKWFSNYYMAMANGPINSLWHS